MSPGKVILWVSTFLWRMAVRVHAENEQVSLESSEIGLRLRAVSRDPDGWKSAPR